MNNNLGNNSVTIADAGYKIVKLVGEPKLPELMETLKKARAVNAELASRFGAIHSLWDFSELTSFAQELVPGTKLFASTSNVDKIAFYGVQEHLKPLLLEIAKEIKDQNTVKYFDDKEEAIKWLLS